MDRHLWLRCPSRGEVSKVPLTSIWGMYGDGPDTWITESTDTEYANMCASCTKLVILVLHTSLLDSIFIGAFVFLITYHFKLSFLCFCLHVCPTSKGASSNLSLVCFTRLRWMLQ